MRPTYGQPTTYGTPIARPDSAGPAATAASSIPGAYLPGTQPAAGYPPPGSYPTGPPQTGGYRPGTPQAGDYRPGAAQPGTPQSEDYRPGAAQPGAAQSSAAQSGAAQPGTYQPGGYQAGSYRPGPPDAVSPGGPPTGNPAGAYSPNAYRPGAAQPGTPQPGDYRPGAAQPGAAQPGTYQPGGYEAGSYRPGQPGAIPLTGNPAGAYPPNAYRPGAAEPGAYQPDSTPGGYQPGSASGGYQPGSASGGYQSGTAQPGGYQPGSTPEGYQSPQPGGYQPGGAQAPGTYLPPPYQPGGAAPPYQPGGAAPGGYQPGGAAPAGYQPGAYQQPGQQPGLYQPSGYPPGTYQPGPYQPGTNQPGTYQPGPYQPGTNQLPGMSPPGAYPGVTPPAGAVPAYTPASGGYAPAGYGAPGYGSPGYGAPPAYYPYPPVGPPAKRRRGRTAAIVSSIVVLVLLVCGGAVFGIVHYADHTTTPTASSGSTPTGATKGTAPKNVDASTVNGMFALQDAALLRGDEKAWLAPIKPTATAAVNAYKRFFHNMRAMHVAVWSQTAVGGDEVLSRSLPYEVDITYCLVVKTCTDTEAEWNVTAELIGGKAMITGYSPPIANAYTSEPFPWEVSTLSAVTGPRVVVAASSEWAGTLSRALSVAERAALAADQYAHWGKPAIYTVYLASAGEGKTWFDGDLRNADGVSYPIQPDDIEVTILMPAAEQTGNAGPGGLNTVIQHEMGHVATLHGDTEDRGHDSFIEGIAEYCAYTGHTSWAVYRLQDVRAYIHGGSWSHQTYLTSQITSKSVLAGSAAYGIGYLTIRYLVATYGLNAMLNFWGDFERDNKSLNTSAEKSFHKSWKSVNASAATYVEHAVGL